MLYLESIKVTEYLQEIYLEYKLVGAITIRENIVDSGYINYYSA